MTTQYSPTVPAVSTPEPEPEPTTMPALKAFLVKLVNHIAMTSEQKDEMYKLVHAHFGAHDDDTVAYTAATTEPSSLPDAPPGWKRNPDGTFSQVG